jgi:hypothetical protein
LTASTVALAIAAAVSISRLEASAPGPSQPNLPWTNVHQRTFRRVPVVVVVFDELPVSSLMTRSGHIDRRLFPNFAQLADDSVWFRNASAVAVLTHTTIPALLTGRYQTLSGPRPDTYPRNLFTFVGRDYDLMAVPPDPRFCPPRLCSTRKERLPPAGSRFGDFGGSLRGENFRGFLRLLRSRPRPALYYLHLVAPHTPWSFLPSGVRYQPDRRPAGELEVPGPGRAWGPDPWLATQAQQQHLLQTSLVDRLVGALVDRLRRESMYERSLLIVTADHGMAFEAGLPKRDPRESTVGEIAYVPLLVKRPFETAGTISDRPVELVDIVPTIADILHLPRVWKHMDGMSLFSPDGPRARERALYDVELSVDGRERYAAVAHKYERFGGEGDSIDLFDVAPGNLEKLLGRAIDDFSIHNGIAATIDFGDEAREHPRLIEGVVVDGEAASPPRIAIGVNGRIAAVTKCYEMDGAMRFSAVLPPGASVDSWADLRAFVITKDGAVPALSPVLATG